MNAPNCRFGIHTLLWMPASSNPLNVVVIGSGPDLAHAIASMIESHIRYNGRDLRDDLRYPEVLMSLATTRANSRQVVQRRCLATPRLDYDVQYLILNQQGFETLAQQLSSKSDRTRVDFVQKEINSETLRGDRPIRPERLG